MRNHSKRYASVHGKESAPPEKQSPHRCERGRGFVGLSFGEDRFGPAEVDVSRGQIRRRLTLYQSCSLQGCRDDRAWRDVRRRAGRYGNFGDWETRVSESRGDHGIRIQGIALLSLFTVHR